MKVWLTGIVAVAALAGVACGTARADNDSNAVYDGTFLNLTSLSNAPASGQAAPDVHVAADKIVMIRPMTGPQPGSIILLEGGTTVNVRETFATIHAALNK